MPAIAAPYVPAYYKFSVYMSGQVGYQVYYQ